MNDVTRTSKERASVLEIVHRADDPMGPWALQLLRDGDLEPWVILRSNRPFEIRRTHEPPVARAPDGYAYRFPTPDGSGTLISFHMVGRRDPIETIPYWLGAPPPPPPAPKFRVGDKVVPCIAPYAKGDIRIRKVETTYRISVDGCDMNAPYSEDELQSALTKGEAP